MELIAPYVKRRCIGGSDIPSVLKTGQRYVESGYAVTYDFMVEELGTIGEVRRAHAVHLELGRSMNDTNRGNIAIKPSMAGLSLETANPTVADRTFEKYLSELLRTFHASGTEIEVDAESSAQLPHKLAVINELRKTLPKKWTKGLRVAVQMHLADITKHAEAHKLFEYPVRIVKGAGVYKEDPRLIVDKKEIERRALQYAYEAFCNGERPYIATVRDRKYIRGLLHDLRCLGVKKDQFEIQLLHGIGWSLARELHDEGYVVRIYIPFVTPFCKDAWKPYVARRIMTLASAWFNDYASRFHSDDTAIS